MSAESTLRSVLVLPAAQHLRRVLDASSWVVLEELLARSTGTTDESIVETSMRALAVDLGVAKGTAARAVARLREVGLVDIVQDRDPTSGTFGVTTYRITVSAEMFDLPAAALDATDTLVGEPATDAATGVATAPAFTRHRSTRTRRVAASQLSLLDV